jgi:hypothetical protein
MDGGFFFAVMDDGLNQDPPRMAGSSLPSGTTAETNHYQR